MKILITGDLVINGEYHVSQIDEEIKNLFKESDINIVNLEAPVTNSTSKILKTGPHLKANQEATKEVLDGLQVDIVTLANNHLLDYDEKGVEDTLDFCRNQNIQTVGGGINLEIASSTLFLDTDKGKIAIINIAENEWASASEKTAGANGMDLIADVKKIQEARRGSDFVFMIVHGGHEYYNLPSPRMQEQYRFYVDNGADLVVAHHTHCISGMEMYKSKPIYYSLGNFLFTKSSKYEDWYKGIVLEVEITEDRTLRTNPIFVEQKRNDFQLSVLTGTSLEEVGNRFREYCRIIQDKEKLSAEWQTFVRQRSRIYLNYFSPLIRNKYVRGLFSKIGWNGSTKTGTALQLNLLRCESHADLSKGIIDNYLKN